MRRALLAQVVALLLGALLAATLVMQLWWWFVSAPPQEAIVPQCPDGYDLYERVVAEKVPYPDFHCFQYSDARDIPTPGSTPVPTLWPGPLVPQSGGVDR